MTEMLESAFVVCVVLFAIVYSVIVLLHPLALLP